MTKFYSMIIGALLIGTTVNAQNWTVGVPVSLKISSLTLNSFGCYPTARANINYPASSVDGVQHGFIITAAVPAGGVEVGAGNVVAVNDTVWVTPNTEVFFTQGNGNLSMDIYAIGTPTMPGQAHPCGFNDLFMSFGLCPEGLNGIMPTNCTTQTSTSVEEATNNGLDIKYPVATTGHTLTVRALDQMQTISVYDLKGSVIAEASAGQQASLDLGSAEKGIYLLTVVLNNGKVVSKKFVLE